MKVANTVISVLLMSAAYASPAFADYFHNHTLNVNLNIGSAPNPTSQDIRASSVAQTTQRNQAPRNVASSSAPAPKS